MIFHSFKINIVNLLIVLRFEYELHAFHVYLKYCQQLAQLDDDLSVSPSSHSEASEILQ